MSENHINYSGTEITREQRTCSSAKLQVAQAVNTFTSVNNINGSKNYKVNDMNKHLSKFENIHDSKITNQNSKGIANKTKSSLSVVTTKTSTTRVTPKCNEQNAKMQPFVEWEKYNKHYNIISPSTHVIQAAEMKKMHLNVQHLERQTQHLAEEREELLNTMEYVLNKHERHMTKIKEQIKEREAVHVENIRVMHIRHEECERHKQKILDAVEETHSKIEQSQRARDELHELLVLESEKLSEEEVKLEKANAKCKTVKCELEVQRQEEIKMSDDAYGLHGEAKEVMLHIKSLLKETEKVKHDAMSEELTRRVLFSRCEELKGTIRVYCRVKAPQHFASVHETVTNTPVYMSGNDNACKQISVSNECTMPVVDNYQNKYKRERSVSNITVISPQRKKSSKATHLSLRSTSMQPTTTIATKTPLSSSRSCSTKANDEYIMNNNWDCFVENACTTSICNKSITENNIQLEKHEQVEPEQTRTPSRLTDSLQIMEQEEEFEYEEQSMEEKCEQVNSLRLQSLSPSPQPYEEKWQATSRSQSRSAYKENSNCKLGEGEDKELCKWDKESNVSSSEHDKEKSKSCNAQHTHANKERHSSTSETSNPFSVNNSSNNDYYKEYNMANTNNSSAVAITSTQKLFSFDNPRFDVDGFDKNNYDNDNEVEVTHADVTEQDNENRTNSFSSTTATTTINSINNNNKFRTITVHQSRANATSTGVVSSSESFHYDCVFAPESTQSEVYLEIEPLVHNAIDGYRICVFAYGQTGSGKTYTMEGNLRRRAEYGVIPRAMETIFRRQAELAKDGWSYELSCTIVEIHNEVIYDLTQNPSIYVNTTSTGASTRRANTDQNVHHKNNTSSKTQHTHSKCYHTIRHNADGTFVSNVQEHQLRNMRDFIRVYERAICNRHTAKTLLNTNSSRSHCIFTLHINGTNTTLRQRSRGVLCLVDLAGSERVNESGATGNQFKEAIKINRSLLDLGKCITAMQTNAVVPWRNSLLTYLLQNYMNAKGAKTLMIVTVSDQAEHLPETVNSLRFAQRVQQTLLGKSVKQITSY